MKDARMIQQTIDSIKNAYNAEHDLPVDGHDVDVHVSATEYALLQIILAQQEQIDDELLAQELEIATLRTDLAALKRRADAHERAHKNWEFEGF